MRSIKLGLALVAALALSIAMTASSASAVTSFLSTVSKAKLLSEKVEEQVFKTNPGEVKCTEAKIEKGETGTAGTEETQQLAEIHYGSCLAFGFVPTTITNADYLFLANGTTHLLKLEQIVSNGCEILVKPQSTTTTKYATVGKNIKVLPNVTGITYTAKGCLSGNGTASNGTYTGNSESMISGGNLSFMP